MSKILKVLDNALKQYPHAYGDNTETYIAVLEYVLAARGYQLPLEVKQAMREYKPESIPRKRRETIESTKAQHEKGYQVYKHYATGVGSNPLDN